MVKSKTKPQPFPIIHKNECKACDRCIISCKNKVLEISQELNDSGYNYVKYKGEGCNGCGDCYYTCPEPLAIEIHIPKKIRKNKLESEISKKEE
ncbi:MAG: ferredoxin family protein [Methanobrevibacter sp.]|nr:ferredoxin family protein [Methanobrevibacter sp.]